MPTSSFLANPAQIRKAVMELQGGKRLDLAVGFIGADWRELLANHRGKLRVICWLSSTNTNPYAVADLMQRPQTEVRQRHSLHSKVYLAPGTGAIVGSANLSRAALSDSDISGQMEAAVRVNNPALVSGIETWFSGLWNDHQSTAPIKDSHLAAAKKAWDKAKASSPHSPGGLPGRTTGMNIPKMPKQLSPELLKYAKRVGKVDLGESIGESCAFTQSLVPATFTKALCREVVDHIVAWTGHRSSYDRFLSQPTQAVRKGLTHLFDDSIDLLERLELIHDQGYLAGLRIPSISLLLYWRNPQRFVPYNGRTVRFLKAFELKAPGMSSSSARCYATWLMWSTRLAQRLNLPTPGHVDRMMELYAEDHKT